MNLNGKVTNPGELRTHIGLYSRSVTSQSGGFQRPSLTVVAEVWSKWENVHGQEAWLASSVNAKAAATVTIRWRADMDPTWVAKKGDQYFEIVSLDNIGERSEYIEMKVQAWQPG